MNNNTLDTVVKLLLILFAVKMLTKIFQAFQIFDTEQDRKESEARKEFNKGANGSTFGLLFNPDDYWEAYVDEIGAENITQYLPWGEMQVLKEKLLDAPGVFNDDENAVFAVFSTIKNFDQLAWLSYYFKNFDTVDEERTGTSLGQHLGDFLNDDDLVTLKDILDGYAAPTLNPETLKPF